MDACGAGMTDHIACTQQKWDGQERRKSPHPNAERREKILKTVRTTRETLTSESGYSKDFDRQILIAHAKNFKAIAFMLLLLILSMGAISLTWLNYFYVMTWVTANLGTQAIIAYQCRHFLNEKTRQRKTIANWHNLFFNANFLSGIIWSAFALIPVTAPSLSQPVFTFTTLLIVVAIYCFISAPLLSGMIAATTPITLAVLYKFTTSGYASLIMMACLFLGAQLLFILMSRQIQDNLIRMFTIRAEKDMLIVDLEEATSVSNESRRRAEEANLAKSRFLATMSHELRTPLNAILGFSEIMKEELLGPLDNKSYKEYVCDIHSSGDHLLNLINEILDLSRIEAGRYELNEEAIALIEVVEDCLALIQIRSKKKNIAVTIAFERDMPRLWADQRAIRQIVLNLLSNAVKFTPQGGEIAISVGWTAGGGQYVSIKDNGPGIPEEEIPIVLSQFGQGSIAIKSAEQGTGLGLPICQALVDMHNGTFDLKSKLRLGTTVTVSFPRARVMQALAPVPGASKQPAPKQSARRIA